jgi:uncharacterized protein (DUF427 family)
MTPAAPDVDRARARPCSYRARAWWGERLVAETTSALRVEAADGPPLLCFPLADVRLELFRDEGRPAACPAVGTARASTPSPSRSTGTSGPTGGCCTATSRRSPATA